MKFKMENKDDDVAYELFLKSLVNDEKIVDDELNQFFLKNLSDEEKKRGKKRGKLFGDTSKTKRSKSPKKDVYKGMEKSELGRFMLMQNLLKHNKTGKNVCTIYPSFDSILELTYLTDMLFDQNDPLKSRSEYIFSLFEKELQKYQIIYYDDIIQPNIYFPTQDILNCMNQPDVDFIFIPLLIVYIDMKAHLNMIVMTKEEGSWVAERFEPGFLILNDPMDSALYNLFGDIHVNYLEPSKYVTNQAVQNLVESSALLIDDLEGFCVMWSFLYANERLISKSSREKVADDLLKRLVSRSKGLIIGEYVLGEKKHAKDILDYTNDIVIYFIIDRINQILSQESKKIDLINQKFGTNFKLVNRALNLN